jgi:hypothetical protein
MRGAHGPSARLLLIGLLVAVIFGAAETVPNAARAQPVLDRIVWDDFDSGFSVTGANPKWSISPLARMLVMTASRPPPVRV